MLSSHKRHKIQFEISIKFKQNNATEISAQQIKVKSNSNISGCAHKGTAPDLPGASADEMKPCVSLRVRACKLRHPLHRIFKVGHSLT